MNTTTDPRARIKRPGARGTGSDRLARAAHWNAARGLAVFPLRPGSKTPALEDWPHEATTDAEQITRWWREAPYNIGVATGPSGLLVIDLDQPKDGEVVPEPWVSRGATCGRDVLDQLAANAGHMMPRTWTVSTPSGGQHLYYRHPDGAELGNTAGRLGWKIDTRGNGGYVVGAGSVLHGQRYRADVIRRPATIPGWIATALIPQPDLTPRNAPDRRNASAYTLAALSGELDKVLAAAPGQRNDTLNRAAFALGQLVGAHLLEEGTIRDELVSAAARIGLPWREADRTITSGLTAGARHPRQRTV
ncbi:bifunctional DNA primase/polymerase [Kribbella sp. NBC_01484]|uniref:bifunctional DNA primase/polymerase n=1 Tax=Kribbella sp. NBC_01484 TaxID=2903579 RepID=UPI002E367279|nr:bifunctional DNA primase/polymerase [Kribbella sp. NBC_01484]